MSCNTRLPGKALQSAGISGVIKDAIRRREHAQRYSSPRDLPTLTAPFKYTAKQLLVFTAYFSPFPSQIALRKVSKTSNKLWETLSLDITVKRCGSKMAAVSHKVQALFHSSNSYPPI